MCFVQCSVSVQVYCCWCRGFPETALGCGYYQMCYCEGVNVVDGQKWCWILSLLIEWPFVLNFNWTHYFWKLLIAFRTFNLETIALFGNVGMHLCTKLEAIPCRGNSVAFIYGLTWIQILALPLVSMVTSQCSLFIKCFNFLLLCKQFHKSLVA